MRDFTHSLLLTELAQRGRLARIEEALAVGAERGASPASVKKAIERLIKSGSLKRVHRGLYVVDVPGLAPLHPFVIGSALSSDAVVSGWSALHHHGLTEQIPRVVEVTTAARVRFGEHRERGVRVLTFESEQFALVTVVESKMFGGEVVWFDQESARVFEKERAILDMFIRPGDFGGMATTLSLIEEHQKSIRADVLVAHAKRLGIVSVAKRVGWALERVGVPVDLTPLLEMKTAGYSLLDPSGPARGPWRARWHLRENL